MKKKKQKRRQKDPIWKGLFTKDANDGPESVGYGIRSANNSIMTFRKMNMEFNSPERRINFRLYTR